jgi:predicted RNase H-like nuclease
MEKYVLGVDAAWTSKNSSGIILIKYFHNSKPEVVRAGRSYDEFCNYGMPVWKNRVEGSTPDFSKIIESCGQKVDLIALDMPLSPQGITGRREADNAISREYGNRKASTHTPSGNRFGELAKIIFDQLTENGFSWASEYQKTPAFIEVYPHVAIIELFGGDDERFYERFPYKVQKMAKYWPNALREERYFNIISNLNTLRNKIAYVVNGIEEILPPLVPNISHKIMFLKGYEDLLDAALSALVGCNYLDGKAEPKPLGDQTGVIWVPKNRPNFIITTNH